MMIEEDPFFPLKTSQKFKKTLEPLEAGACVCGHGEVNHLGTGNRNCMVSDCACNKYDKYSPKFHSPKDFEQKAMVYFEQQKTMLENVRWVFENLTFFRNYSNQELGWAWGKFVLGYDPFEQFMTHDIYEKVKKYGTHAIIEREARRLREECKKSHTQCNLKSHEKCGHECKYCPYDPSLIDSKLEKEFGIYSYFAENKI